MTIYWIKITIFAVLVSACFIQQNTMAQYAAPVAVDANSPNLILNGSFEADSQSWDIPANAQISVSSESIHGKKSLKFVNNDSNSYETITQKISVSPGQIIRYSGWIKGENLVSKNANDKGASLFVEAYGGGKYIFGDYQRSLSGTFEWTYLEGVYYLPDHATDFIIGVYQRKGTTGTAWFDDIQVSIDNASPFNATVLYPNYRQSTPAGDKTPWNMLLQYNPNAKWKQANVKSRIISANQKTLFTESIVLPADKKEHHISYKPSGKLPVGRYQWKIDFSPAPTEKTQSFSFDIQVVDKMPLVHIDKSGLTIQNGEPFFPLGVYLAGPWSATNEDFQRISDAGANTVLAYSYGDDWQDDAPVVSPEEFLNNAQNHQLKVIYSLKDMYDGHGGYPRNNKTGLATATEYVNRLKDHPAILSWYINDEFGPDWMPQLKARYEHIKSLDAKHPTYQVLMQYGLIQKYFATTDAWGTDPYPINARNNRHINLVTDMTKKTLEAGRGSKGMWQVIQVFDDATYNKEMESRAPTLDEMRNMSYQALINGATGLIYYSYFDLWYADHTRQPSREAFDKRWPDVQRLISEVKPLTEVILKNKKVSLQETAESPVQYQAWQDGNKLYLVVASTESENMTLKLNVPNAWKIATQKLVGISGEQNGDTLTLRVSPQASGIIVLEK